MSIKESRRDFKGIGDAHLITVKRLFSFTTVTVPPTKILISHASSWRRIWPSFQLHWWFRLPCFYELTSLTALNLWDLLLHKIRLNSSFPSKIDGTREDGNYNLKDCRNSFMSYESVLYYLFLNLLFSFCFFQHWLQSYCNLHHLEFIIQDGKI